LGNCIEEGERRAPGGSDSDAPTADAARPGPNGANLPHKVCVSTYRPSDRDIESLRAANPPLKPDSQGPFRRFASDYDLLLDSAKKKGKGKGKGQRHHSTNNKNNNNNNNNNNSNNNSNVNETKGMG
jgi:hypothetical protein